MKSYSEMSDFEINCAVGKLMPNAVCFNDDGEPYTLEPDSCPAYSGSDFNEVNFEPCNSWADAGPIIMKSLIGIKPVSLFVGGHRWFAFEGDAGKEFNLKAADNNPLRAAMIVFLMMQESK